MLRDERTYIQWRRSWLETEARSCFLKDPYFGNLQTTLPLATPGLLDCASEWLLSQNNLDLLHITYVGPRLQDGRERRRTPLAIKSLKLPRRGGLRVPLAEATAGSDTLGFTEAETRERLVKGIEQHWLVRVWEDERSPPSTRCWRTIAITPNNQIVRSRWGRTSLIAPRMDPHVRSLAHAALIADE